MSHQPSLSLSSEPVVEPLTLAETKAYLRIANADDDTLLTDLIKAVRKAAEQFLCGSLITQSWKISYDKYAPSSVELPMGPVQSVTSVTVIARDGSQAALAGDSYYLSAGNRKLVFDASPLGHRVEIIYVAGYGNSESNIPSPIRYGMLAHIAAIYDGRAGGDYVPQKAVEFYLPFRVVKGF